MTYLEFTRVGRWWGQRDDTLLGTSVLAALHVLVAVSVIVASVHTEERVSPGGCGAGAWPWWGGWGRDSG